MNVILSGVGFGAETGVAAARGFISAATGGPRVPNAAAHADHVSAGCEVVDFQADHSF